MFKFTSQYYSPLQAIMTSLTKTGVLQLLTSIPATYPELTSSITQMQNCKVMCFLFFQQSSSNHPWT